MGELNWYLLEMTTFVKVVIKKINSLLWFTSLVILSGMVLAVLVAPAVPSTLLRGSVRTCLHQLLMTLSYVSVRIIIMVLRMHFLK